MLYPHFAEKVIPKFVRAALEQRKLALLTPLMIVKVKSKSHDGLASHDSKQFLLTRCVENKKATHRHIFHATVR